MMAEHKTSTEGTPSPTFPVDGLLPKLETQAAPFITAHPQYDGRNTVVAIFDTGTDPGAPGLSVTPDGKRKIIDCVDASGSGDVDTSTVVTATANADGVYTVTGLSGRTLYIPTTWKNESQKYHIGVKRAYELFPEPLVERLKNERKTAWDQQQRVVESELVRQVDEYERKKKESKCDDKDESKDKQKEDLDARLAELRSLQKSYQDVGPVYDIVTFYDGQHWRVAIDRAQDGRFQNCKLLTNYRVECEYDTFSEVDMMNYSVNVYEDGNVVSIVVTAGSHGTHVAGIVGAYYPDHPELNGIAPGCQMISVKIGDSRLGSMETGTGLLRGLMAALDNKVDLINMSYGEAASLPNVGRFGDMLAELVNKHGIIFVSSAGNAGPALTTVGAPGATHSASIGVGAYVSPSMMAADYSLRKKLPETQYTWSSRGPAADGSRGVCISACGGAITTVPTWTLQGSQLMNGTSMSSPAACGGLSLLVSALKGEKITFTPHRIRRAIENTARIIPTIDPWGLGCGLLQIDAAFNYLTKYASFEDQDLWFKISMNSVQGQPARGIYLREPWETLVSHEVAITVDPKFIDESTSLDSAPPSVNQKKVDFNLRIALQTTASDWIEIPSHLMLMHGGRAFTVALHPQCLPSGAHFAEILGYDSTRMDRGPMFRVPITALVPEKPQIKNNGTEKSQMKNLTHSTSETLSDPAGTYRFHDEPFQPAHILRKFLIIPHHATWVEFTIKGKKIDTQRTFMLHCLFLQPESAYRNHEINQHFQLLDGSEHHATLDVVGGCTMELCLAQFWSSIGDTTVDIDVVFHSIAPSKKVVAIDMNHGFARVNLHSALRLEHLDPHIELKKISQPVRPSTAVIEPCRKTDVLPNQKQVYQIMLTYNWEAKEEVKVIPRAPMLQGILYESTYGSQLFMLFDSNKKLMGTGDAWPHAISVKKGKYVLRLQVTHDDVAQLEKLKEMAVLFESSLPKSIDLSAYPSYNTLITGGTKFGDRRTLKPGATKIVWIAPPDTKSLPTWAKQGDILTGHATWGKPTGPQSKRPGSFPVRVVVGAPSNPEKKNDTASTSTSNTNAILDLVIRENETQPGAKTPAKTPAKKKNVDKNDDKEKEDEDKEKEKEKDKEKKDDDKHYDVELEMRDVQIEHVRGLKGEKRWLAYQALIPTLLTTYPKHLPLLSLRIDVLADRRDSIKDTTAKLQHYNDIIHACDSLIHTLDMEKLAAHYGKLVNSEDTTQVKLRKEVDKIKSQLIDALTMKATILMEQYREMTGEKDDGEKKEGDEKAASKPVSSTDTTSILTSFYTTLSELSEWIDINHKDQRKRYLQILSFADQQKGWHGLVLKRLNDEITNGDQPPSKATYAAREKVLKRLGWKHWSQYERDWECIRFPKSYTLH